MNFLPINMNIEGKRILIIGGGRVGLHKAKILHRFTDEATVISASFLDGFSELPFTQIRKEYEPSDLEGAFLVYVCTESPNSTAVSSVMRRPVGSSAAYATHLHCVTSPHLPSSRMVISWWQSQAMLRMCINP